MGPNPTEEDKLMTNIHRKMPASEDIMVPDEGPAENTKHYMDPSRFHILDTSLVRTRERQS